MSLPMQPHDPSPDIRTMTPHVVAQVYTRVALIVALAMSLAASLASAQGLERVEEIWGDAGPLNESMRVLPLDLRAPVGFQGVYRVPGHDNLLTRMDGGLAAVFPRSVYAATSSGIVPLIPPGTVFHVGGVSDIKPAPSIIESKGSLLGISMRQDQRVDHRVSMPRPQTNAITPRVSSDLGSPVAQQAGQQIAHGSGDRTRVSGDQAQLVERSIWEDEWYRRERVADLIGRFAR